MLAFCGRFQTAGVGGLMSHHNHYPPLPGTRLAASCSCFLPRGSGRSTFGWVGRWVGEGMHVGCPPEPSQGLRPMQRIPLPSERLLLYFWLSSEHWKSGLEGWGIRGHFQKAVGWCVGPGASGTAAICCPGWQVDRGHVGQLPVEVRRRGRWSNAFPSPLDFQARLEPGDRVE